MFEVNLGYAADYDEIAGQLQSAQQQPRMQRALVHDLLATMPRERQWEHGYLAMQERAEHVLQAMPV